MTISSTNRKAGPFSGNGSTVAFPFSFKVFSTDDVVVIATSAAGVESTLSMGASYTVALNPDQNATPGGTVTMLAAPATETLLTLTSDIANLQPVDLTNNGGFYPTVINSALDRLTILTQQLAEKVSRALKVNISSSEDATPDALMGIMTDAVASSTASESAAAASAASAAASTASMPNIASGANTIPVVNPSGTGWLAKSAAQFLEFLGLGVANTASGVVVLDSSSNLPVSNGVNVTGIPNFWIPPRPGISQYWTTSGPGDGSQAALSTGTIKYIPVSIPSSITVSALSVYVNSVEAAKNIRIGLYADNGGIPGLLIADVGTASVATSGVKDVSYSATIPKGEYWLAFMTDATGTATFCTMATSGSVPSRLGSTVFSSTGTVTGRIMGWSATQAYGAMPADAGSTFAAITANAPTIMLKVA